MYLVPGCVYLVSGGGRVCLGDVCPGEGGVSALGGVCLPRGEGMSAQGGGGCLPGGGVPAQVLPPPMNRILDTRL